jgi:hypothetical protein
VVGEHELEVLLCHPQLTPARIVLLDPDHAVIREDRAREGRDRGRHQGQLCNELEGRLCCHMLERKVDGGAHRREAATTRKRWGGGGRKGEMRKKRKN